MRDALKKYGYFIVAAIFLIVAVLIIKYLLTPTPPAIQIPKQAFYVDEETGEETVGAFGQITPLIGKSGKPTVVRAVKYTCDGGKTTQVLMYVKFTDEAKAALEALPKNNAVADLKRASLEMNGQLVRRPAKDSPWIPLSSNEARQIATLPNCPDGKPARAVSP